MNSLYLDKRNFFNCKLNLMSSHNRELRQQRIREMEQATPNVHLKYIHMVGPDKDIDHFADTFLRKKRDNTRGKKRVWNNRYNLRIAYQRIETWKTHYKTDKPITEKKNKISFCL